MWTAAEFLIKSVIIFLLLTTAYPHVMVVPCPADAITQTLVQADVAWAFGLIDLAKKRVVEAMQNEVVDLVGIPWQESRGKREGEHCILSAEASGQGAEPLAEQVCLMARWRLRFWAWQV